jgi:hypothetical protein
MEEMDYWRLCDKLSVVQAALLTVGLDPEEYANIMYWKIEEYPENFYAAFTAFSNAIISKKLEALIHYKKERLYHEGLNVGESVLVETDEPDWDRTIISIDDIRSWLESRGIRQGFFFPQADDTPDYLDKTNKNYAPKLAAAIGAWQAINADPGLIKGKTVKQALLKWLRKNADRFGLTKEDGNPNEQGIEEIAKISNWDVKGGAPKTPV